MIKIPSCLIMVVLHYMFLREHCVISPEVDIYLIYEFEIPLKARGKKKLMRMCLMTRRTARRCIGGSDLTMSGPLLQEK